MTRLFIATGIFHPEPGGPATYLNEILPGLQQNGFDVQLLTFGDAPTPERDYGYPVTRIPRTSLPSRTLAYARAAQPRLAWADLVYLHSLGLPLWGAWRAPRVMKIVGDLAWERAIRRGWVTPDTDIDAFQTARVSLPAAAGKAARAREARTLDHIIVPSEYLKRMVVGWGAEARRVQVIYNALPMEPEGERLSQAEARARLTAIGATDLDMTDGAPLILTVGRILPWKGVDHLIAALPAVPGARLVAAGGGDLLPALQAQADALGVADRVRLLGNVPRERVALWMRAADYVALYSGYEGLSHTLLESLRAGTPVIASDKGGNPEVVQHDVNGLLVPYIDREALASALVEALRPGVRDRLAANHAVGMARFTFARMLSETAAALHPFA